MKQIFSIFFFCLIFGSSLKIELEKKMKLAKIGLAMRSVVLNREKKLRKLDGTDSQVDSSTGSTSEPTTPPVVEYEETPSDAPETGNAAANYSMVPVNKPVAQKPKETGKADAGVQVNKFHSFTTNTKENKVSFGVVFYFFEKPIVRFIIMRLRITYSSRSRNLQEGTGSAESARTDCEISNPDLVGKTKDDGQNVNYNCEANTTQSSAGANFTLNTDVPLTMVAEN